MEIKFAVFTEDCYGQAHKYYACEHGNWAFGHAATVSVLKHLKTTEKYVRTECIDTRYVYYVRVGMKSGHKDYTLQTMVWANGEREASKEAIRYWSEATHHSEDHFQVDLVRFGCDVVCGSSSYHIRNAEDVNEALADPANESEFMTLGREV